MNRLIRSGRMVTCVIVTIALIIIYFATLYKLQIVEGAAYYEASQNNNVTERTVAAARGDILDRYGRVLVTSKECTNITLNSDELFSQEDPNAAILKIVEIITGCGDTYNDELPVTMESPFAYTNMSDVSRYCLDKYIKDKEAAGLTTDMSAVELMAYFRDRYEIDTNYDSREMRIIAGIRYALNMHYVVKTADYIFAEDVSIETVTRLMESGIKGIEIYTSYVREYNTEYAAHVLGYTGMMSGDIVDSYLEKGYSLNAMVGLDGVELAFEELLHGTDGTVLETSTADGTVVSSVYTKEPIPGNNVYLTLDIGLQAAAEQALGSFIEETNVAREESNATFEEYGFLDDIQDMITGGAVVVMDVDSCEPLAMASYPTFDVSTVIEDFAEILEAENNPMFNRAIQGTYAPGSTFKPCTSLAALCENIISTGTKIDCTGKYMEFADQGYAPECWIYPDGVHGELDVIHAIENSCNFFYYDTGRYLGIDKLSGYALDLGLGSYTGIELPEYKGSMGDLEWFEDTYNTSWVIGDTMQSAIGQGYTLFTPLQLATYTSVLANGGTRYSTSLLKEARSYDYSETTMLRESEVMAKIDANEEYFQAIREGMTLVSNSPMGSAYDTFFGYQVNVASKTGTAQLGEDITNNAIFICFAPAEDPEVAVAVVVEHGGAGKAVAPIAKEVLDYYFSFKNATSTLESEMSILK